MQQSAATLTECWHFRALIIDLTVERHQHQYGLQLLIFGVKRAPLIQKLVGKVFDGVTEDLQSAPGLGGNATAPPGVHTGSGGDRR